MKRLLISATFLLGQFTCFAQTKGKSSPYPPTLDKLQGVWVHNLDTLAVIKIKNNTWTYGYKSDTNTSYFDSFTISFKDTIFSKENTTSQILILSRPKENEEYEIIGLTDTTFSTLDHSRGHINLYYKQARRNR